MLDLISLDGGLEWPLSCGPSSTTFFLDEGGGTCKDTPMLKGVSVVHILISFRIKCVCNWTNAPKLVFIV
jgi:hypothetical protein